MAYVIYFQKLLAPLTKFYGYLGSTERAAYHGLMAAVSDLSVFMLKQPTANDASESVIAMPTDDGPVKIWLSDREKWMQKVKICRLAAEGLRTTCCLFDHPDRFVKNVVDTFPVLDAVKLLQDLVCHFVHSIDLSTTASRVDTKPNTAAPVKLLTAAEANALSQEAECTKLALYQAQPFHAEVMTKIQEAAAKGEYEIPLAFLGKQGRQFWSQFEKYYEQAGYTYCFYGVDTRTLSW